MFGRRKEPPAAGHDAFWSWWAETGAATFAAAIADGTVVDLAEQMSERVHAISTDLAWELGPGLVAEHALVVTAEGKAEARAVARRWLRAAPPASATWEYADQRRPSDTPEDGELRVGDAVVDFASVRVRAERVGNHVEVAVHHPLLRSLPEQARGTVVFLALDHALGEDACETWIAGVEVALDPPADPVDLLDLAGLRALVTSVRDDSLDADGDPVWVLLRGEDDGVPLMAAAQVPLAPAWAPHLDLHVEVVVPYRDATPEGLPTGETLDALRALEDHLAERLGGSGRLVAHETARGTRTLHHYVDSAGPAAAVLEGAVGGWTQGRVEVRATPDPSWHGVRHLRT